MRYSKIALLGFLMLNLAGLARAQQQERNHARVWVQSQRQALASFSSFEVEALVRHSVESGNGQREAEARLRFSGDPLQPAGQPEILSFILNGDSLDTSGGRRVQQGLTSMMSPEIGPLLYGFIPPVLSVGRMRMVGDPQSETIDGQQLVRYRFLSNNEPGRPGLQDGRRPPIERPRPGNIGRPGSIGRPPVNPPNGFGPDSPPMARPGEGSPIERTSLWFDSQSNQLIMSSTELKMPGGRSLVVESRYERVNGVDVPVWRTVKGTFTMQRRLRSITAKLEHESMYSGYSFK